MNGFTDVEKLILTKLDDIETSLKDLCERTTKV